LHWFHKRLEANVKNPRENRCFQTIIVFSFGSFYNSNKCTVLWKIAASLITVSTSVNKEMWVKLRIQGPHTLGGPGTRGETIGDRPNGLVVQRSPTVGQHLLDLFQRTQHRHQLADLRD